MFRCFVAIILISFCCFFAPDRVAAQDYASLFRSFDAGRLTRADKRFLQTALAFEGHYHGLLDGDWGRLSQAAMTSFSRQEFGTRTEEWHMAVLALKFFERYDNEGWQIEYFDSVGVSLLVPQKSFVVDPPSENFANWRHTRSSLSYSAGVLGRAGTKRLHDFTLERHVGRDAPYTVRKDNLAVSTSKDRDSVTLYTRSDYSYGSWSTVMLSANKRDEATLMAVAASISPTRGTPIIFTDGGALENAVRMAIAYVADDEDARPQTAEGTTDSREGGGGAAGSGFIVSENGHVLTNAHVVENCTSILVDGKSAWLVTASEEFDLALLRTDLSEEKSVAVFSAGPAKLNSDVTVVGYPYAGLLGGLNVTRGAVSGLSGLAGDSFKMQITAPVQTGNSGGPLVASDGEIVGVVVAKLDALKFADVVGDLPQNVNYAVRGEIAKLFLAQNGVEPKLGYTDERVDPVELAERASKFTSFVECQ